MPDPTVCCLFVTALCLLVNISQIAGSASGSCCPGENGPITNCSFEYTNADETKETVPCKTLDLGIYGSGTGCPDYAYINEGAIPAPVDNVKTSIFYTSCDASLPSARPLHASSCHTPCQNTSREVYAGLNITFEVDPYTAEETERIQLALWEGSLVYCHYIDFGMNGITKKAAEQHVFYYDGFTGLRPYRQYDLKITTLPTDASSEAVTISVTVPPETCWKPHFLVHDTPFAINLTLFEDEEYNFSLLKVILNEEKDIRVVDFSNAELYEIDGKRGTNLLFDCLDPSISSLTLIIYPPDCRTCLMNRTEVQVKAAPPSVTCPADITIYVELSDAQTVSNISWPEPVFTPSGCQVLKEGRDFNRSHVPFTSDFMINRTTEVSYVASQYGKDAHCTFTVTVVPNDTTPPITYCPADIVMFAEPGSKQSNVTWDKPMAYDLSPLRFIPNKQNGSLFPVGQNITVRYKIIDVFGNSDMCVFHVLVKGTPVASTLVIILSCLIGLCLAVIVISFIYWKKYKRSRDIITGEAQKDIPHGSASIYSSAKGHGIHASQVMPLMNNGTGMINKETNELMRMHSAPELRPIVEDRNSTYSDSSSQYTGSDVDSPVSLESTC